MNAAFRYTISYGKQCIPVYRVNAAPLVGIARIPESPFEGRANTLFAAEIDVEVFGNNFLPAYTEGDNTNVVATDSMKNFVLRQALAYEGATLEGLLELLGRQFLAVYPQMQVLRLAGRELPFVAARVPQGGGFADSGVLFKRSHDDYTFASLDLDRDGEAVQIGGHRCGRIGLQLLKVSGSAFTSFVRDAYTTLVERSDRPLFIYLDVYWRYADVAALLAPDLSRYVAAEQVRDFLQTIFHEFVSESIQHLVHEMGVRLLERFPQLAEVTFEAQNRTRDLIVQSDADPQIKVYSDPFPAYGKITLTLSRSGQ